MTIWMVLFAKCSAQYEAYKNVKIRSSRLLISSNKVKYSFYFLLSGLAPFLVAALRYNVGTDYAGYINKYIPNVLFGEYSYITMEPLYATIIEFADYLGDYQWVFVVTHFLIIWFIYKAISYDSPDIVMSVALVVITGFYNSSLNIMRQSIAVAIFLFSIKYIQQKDFAKYIAYIIFASLFHSIAWVFLPFYILSFDKFDVNHKTIWVCAAVALRLFCSPMRNLFVAISSKFDFYSSYFGSVYDTYNSNIMYFVVNILITLLAVYVEHIGEMDCSERRKYNIYFVIQYVSLALSALAPVIPNCNRIISIFSAGQIIYLPILFKNIKNKKERQIIVFAIMVGYFAVTYKMYYIGNAGGTFPYQTIWKR